MVCTAQAQDGAGGAADAEVLRHTVAALDSALFGAYNRGDLARIGELVADDLEFLHDQTGRAVGRSAFVQGVRQHVCGKVRRDPVPGSVTISPLRGYGAVETGEHRFCDARRYGTCPDSASGVARFVMVWQQLDRRRWRLARVISYDHVSSHQRPASGPSGRPSDADRPPPFADSLERLVPVLLSRFRVPSVAIAFVSGGRVRWTRVWGEQAPVVAANERTLYNVASLTKPVFAQLVLTLAASGQVALDDPVASTWTDPDIASDARRHALTLRRLLSHQSGFPNWRRETGGTLRFRVDPGTRYDYSGEGFEYAARVIERVTRQSLDSIGRSAVFAPLGMGDAAFVEQPWFRGRVALPHDANGRPAPAVFSRRGNAADDLYATVVDYGRFLAQVMSGTDLPRALARQRDSVHAVDAGTGAICRSASSNACPTVAGYGLGWSILHYASGETVYWHTGSDAGERAMVAYLPTRGDGVVMLSNGAAGFEVMIDVGQLLFRGSHFADFLRAGR